MKTAPSLVRVYTARLPGEAYKPSRYVATGVTCEDPFDYWRGMAVLWDLPVTLVNVEHDMEFSDELVAELLDCPHPRCSHAYQCDMSRTNRVWVHSYDGHGMAGTWVREGEEWAAYSAIGFCKLTAEARSLPLGRAPWQGLERSVNDAAPGAWHIHWPGVQHYHLRERDEAADA